MLRRKFNRINNSKDHVLNGRPSHLSKMSRSPHTTTGESFNDFQKGRMYP